MQPGSWLNQKTCPQGHTYLAQLVACPICAKEAGGATPLKGRPKMPQKTVVMDAPALIAPTGNVTPLVTPQPPMHTGTERVEVPNLVQPAAPEVEEEPELMPLAFLLCKKGIYEGADFDLYPPSDGPYSTCKIGSDPACEIQFDDPHMEPVHAEIRCLMREGELIFIIINRSELGTYMNANPQPIQLQELIIGDTILCGSTIFQFGLYGE